MIAVMVDPGMASRPSGRELRSWKEIAHYLGVSVRTAQQWERERGLPLRRIPGGTRDIILAYSSDLEEWKRGTSEAAPEPASVRGSRWWLWLAPVGLITLAAAVFFGSRLLLTSPPASLRLEHNTLRVFSQEGKELWRHSFQDPFMYPEFYEDTRYRTRYLFHDIDGDGHLELLFAHVPADIAGKDGPLYCFSDRGGLKWVWNPGRSVASRKEKFAPNHFVENVGLVRRPGNSNPWIVADCSHSKDYPARVALLSSDGKLLREYWHSGSFYQMKIADVHGDGRDRIVLGGVNNGENLATVVVLDPETMAGASAERNPDYQLQGFSSGSEEARVLFPRSCISARILLRSSVGVLSVGKGAIVVSTSEGQKVEYLFELDDYLRLKKSTAGDGFVLLHQQMHESRQLDHAFSEAEQESMARIVRLR